MPSKKIIVTTKFVSVRRKMTNFENSFKTLFVEIDFEKFKTQWSVISESNLWIQILNVYELLF